MIRTLTLALALLALLAGPAQAAENDLLLVFVSKDNNAGTGWTVPSGWTTINGSAGFVNQWQYVGYKVETDTEPSFYTWEHDDEDQMRAILVQITGASTTGQPHKVTANDTSGVNPSCAPVTTEVDNVLIVYAVFQDSNATLTQPAGTTLVTSGGGSTISLSVATKVQATAGSTGMSRKLLNA